MATVGQYELDSYTKLLLHMDDSAFVDACGKTVTVSDVTLDTTNKKIGIGSGAFTNTSTCRLSVQDSDDWHFNGDFTIDFWIKVTNSAQSARQIFGQRSDMSYCPVCLEVYNTTQLQMMLSFNNVTWETSGVRTDVGTLTGEWQHVAIVRHGSLFTIYVDGVTKATYTSTSSFTNKASQFLIGGISTGEYSPDCNIDEFRISKGIARWTSDFNLEPTVTSPTNLIATADDSQVTLSWTAVDGATSYNVKRSTTADGTYTTIASDVSGTSYVDTSVTNGITYYYVVTAVTANGESNNSNEASATPVAVPVDNSKVLLRITMSDSSEREYKVSIAEKDSFIKWFNRSDVVAGNSSYEFDKDIDGGKEYLAFDKIISFETITYDKQILLRLTLSDSSEREYKVTTDMIDSFLKWFNRSNVTVGNTSYLFNKDIDGGKEYLALDKIISFEVMELK